MTIKPKIASIYKGTFLLFAQLVFLISFSQDVHFSQSVASLQQRNAAFSNNFEGNFQLYSIYREQWGSVGVPFKTSMLGFNVKIDPYIDRLTFFAGMNYLNDQSGDANLNVNRIALNLGATYQLESNQFTLAISNGLVSKQFNANALVFPEQYNRNTGTFDRSISNTEDLNTEKLNYWNLGAALRWNRELNPYWELNSGLSFDNLNQADESFFGTSNSQELSFGIQAEAIYKWKESISLVPYASFYRREKASETVFGAGAKFHSSKESNVSYIQPFLYTRAGVSRNLDALIIGSYIGIGKFSLGASYDFNVSNLELASNYQGAFELSLVYTGKSKSIDKRAIPCERF